MEPVFILIKVDVRGQVQASVTNEADIPENFILPGEFAFTVMPADWAARHMHGDYPNPFRPINYPEGKDTQ